MDNFGGIFWCRGNSWFTYGVMAFLEILEVKIDGGVRQYLVDTFKAQASTLLKLQGEDGLWHTVLTDADSYGEVSGTAAIAAGLRFRQFAKTWMKTARCSTFRPVPAWAWTPTIIKTSSVRRWLTASRLSCLR